MFLLTNLAFLQMSNYIGHRYPFQRPLSSWRSLGLIPSQNTGYRNFDNMTTRKSSTTAEPSIEEFIKKVETSVEESIKKAEPSVEEFIKQSIAYKKSLRFQQCYFNPISCFR